MVGWLWGVSIMSLFWFWSKHFGRSYCRFSSWEKYYSMRGSKRSSKSEWSCGTCMWNTNVAWALITDMQMAKTFGIGLFINPSRWWTTYPDMWLKSLLLLTSWFMVLNQIFVFFSDYFLLGIFAILGMVLIIIAVSLTHAGYCIRSL